MITRPAGLTTLVKACVSHPWLVLLLWSGLLFVAGLGVSSLTIETSTDSVLDRRDEAWRFYQKSIERFGGDEVVVVALPNTQPFSPDLLAAVEGIERRLGKVPGVRRVDSLASVPFVDSKADGTLELAPFLSTEVGEDVVTRLRRSLEIDRIAPRTLISADGRVVAFNVVLERESEVDLDKVVADIREVVEGREAWISGVPIFRTEINIRTGSEILLFVSATIAIVVLLMVLSFRSWLAAGIALASGGVGSWVLVGAMGATGQPLMLATMILPSVMLAVGCAYSMHLLARARGPIATSSLILSISEVAFPLAISGLTTAVGFLGIAAVRIDAVRAVGVFGAIGVVTVVMFALTGAPALLALRRLPAPRGRSSWHAERTATSLVSLVQRRRLTLFVAWAFAVLASVHGLRLLNVETDAVLWFSPSSGVRTDYEAIRRSLAGISPVNVVVESTNGGGVTEVETIIAVDRLTQYLEKSGDVGRAISLGDPLRQLHGGFVGGGEQELPATRAAIEQYLLLLESVPQISDLVTADRRAANIRLRVDNNGSSHLLGVAEEAERWWELNGPSGTTARATGIMFEFARAQHEISHGQIRGLVVAFVCILMLLLVIYRSPGLVFAALLPNVVAILMVFGIMGLLGLALDAGTVVIGSLALGIAVDDTVHLVTAYCENRASKQSREEALRRALVRVLVPMAYTSVVIAMGFGVFGLSDFSFTRNLGLLTAGIMVICFAADALMLPALLLSPRRR